MIKNILPSNRNFGIVFFVVFLIISFWPLLNDGNIKVWSIILAIFFLILGLINSRILTPLNIVWYKFGILLGSVVSPIVMGIVFFTVVTPTSLLMKIFGKNLLGLKKNNKRSYWIERSQIKSKMNNQF
ncbi:SxtJ family membrane protein [Candidatus Pelagibacter bacterium]|nr:SxtJ family membrane protein [Candidatus Pelagibacter bacterium]MDA8841677.1 SxtJ family membrane protein [Candidatus Pelagibacter bacterium]